jgi:hypothetical protein
VGSYEFFVRLGARTPGLFLGCWFLIHDALLIECEQAFENLFVCKIDNRKPQGRGRATARQLAMQEMAVGPAPWRNRRNRQWWCRRDDD